jgi:hypothetical protein
MEYMKTKEGFDVLTYPFNGLTAIVRNGMLGEIFSNKIDAIDWGSDTECGKIYVPSYPIKPIHNGTFLTRMLMQIWISKGLWKNY